MLMVYRHPPPALLNIETGQRVSLMIAKRTNEDFVPITTIRAFGGSGNRLGAPVPHASTSAGGAAIAPAPAGPSAPVSGDSGDRPSMQTKWEVDRTQPTAQIRLRLPTNPRYPVTLNLTHTIGDLRNLINA